MCKVNGHSSAGALGSLDCNNVGDNRIIHIVYCYYHIITVIKQSYSHNTKLTNRNCSLNS